MFDIEYKGGNTVVLTTKKAKLISDPKQSVIGLKDVDTKGAIAVATEVRLATDNKDALLQIEGPGEYEVADFSIRGIATERHLDGDTGTKLSTIYRIEIGDVRIALVGNVGENLQEDQLEAIGVVDIVIVPVGGGGYTLDAVKAAHVVRAIDAKIVVPIHYAESGLNYEVPQDGLDLFKKEFEAEVEQTSKYKIKAASALPLVPTIIELART